MRKITVVRLLRMDGWMDEERSEEEKSREERSREEVWVKTGIL